MSHATYAFLFSATEDVLDSRSVADVEYLFEDLYANDFCDENNWYQPEVVVFRDGSFLPMAPKDDHRGRDFFQDEIDRMPQDQRWAFAKRFGLDTIVHDFGILGFSPFGLIPNTGQRAIEDYSEMYLTRSLTSCTHCRE
jgi:hypothetical protein